MPVTMYRSSREQLAERRRKLLDDANITREQLEAKASSGTLSGQEFDLWDEIQSIDFLMGECDDD